MIDLVSRQRTIGEISQISDELRRSYLKRMSIPYVKKGEERLFIDQFLQGSGSELENKFWSTRSSSRIGFDLYSWLAHVPDCLDIQFEYKLPGILSKGRECKANMDVFIETGNEIWLIESKFTELVNNHHYGKDLPEAYWKELSSSGEESENGNYYHSTSGKLVEYSLLKRFRNHEFSSLFKSFCQDIEQLSLQIPKQETKDWFDAKQETCHLFGIICYVLEGRNKGKKVHFKNIVFHFGDEGESLFAIQFMKRARSLLDAVLEPGVVDYQTHWMQEVIQQYGDMPAYQTEDSVKNLLSTNFCVTF